VAAGTTVHLIEPLPGTSADRAADVRALKTTVLIVVALLVVKIRRHGRIVSSLLGFLHSVLRGYDGNVALASCEGPHRPSLMPRRAGTEEA
jgi:hypothetical protein